MNSILMVGDSYAAGYLPGGVGEKGIAETLGLPAGLRQAVSGSMAVQWAANFDRRLDRAVATQADCAVVSLLGNDAMAAMTDGKITFAEKVTGLVALHTVLRRLAATHPRVIVMLYPDPWFGRRPDVTTALQAVNMGIAAIAALFANVTLLPLINILGPQHFDGSDMHPLQAGYDVAAAEIVKLLESTPTGA